MNKTRKAVLITAGILGVIYVSFLPLASNGYGYMGYHGYHSSPSFFYFGGPSMYYDRSVRNGSRSGPNTLGGGPGSGK